MLGRFSLKCLEAEAEANVAEVRYCPHDPTGKQQRFLELDCLEALYGGAAGGGKSDALLMAALMFVGVQGYSAILFRRTYTDLALPGAIMDRAYEWLSGSAAHWNDRDKVWTFPTGARLAFGYLDGPRDHFRYQSAEFQFVGFDELSQFEERQYRYLFSRLRRKAGMDVPIRMRGATNPGGIGHDWVKDRFLDNPGERVFVPAKLDDNPHTDRAEYERALAELDPITQQQLRDGLWVRDSTGLVYFAFRDANNLGDSLPLLADGEEWSHVLAADFGVVDPTAFVELAFSQYDPVVYVTRSEQWKDMSPSEAAEEARRWESNAGGYDAIVGDVGGLGKGFEAEWRKRFYMPMRAAQKGDKLGYQKLLNGDLHHGKIVVLPGNERLVKDLKSLAWKDEQHTKEHPGMPNHLPDALLYGWREARHWDWEERPPPALTGQALAEKQMADRKERVKERIKKQREESQEESWDWSEDNGKQWDPWAD